jgi:hypothetical protein
MELYLVRVQEYKYGKASGDLRGEYYVAIKAQNRENAKRVARGFTNSTAWSADRTPYADLRTLRKVKNRRHLQKLCEEMGLGTMEKPIFSEEDSEESSEEDSEESADDFNDLLSAAESSLGFWDNPWDDEDWNDA